MRYFDDISPAAPASANRVSNLQSAAIYSAEHSKQDSDIQRRQAEFLARRCGLDRDRAAVLAGMIFGESAR